MNNTLKRMDPTIIQNIVKLIHENGSIRKTPLLGRTNLDYPHLNAYLKWLELTDFIQIKNQNIMLAENGMKFISKC